MASPFETLGLTSEIISGLDDGQISVLVQSTYRTLVKIHHPDVLGGNSNKFKTIQTAFEELNQDKDYKQYLFHKRWYLKPKNSKLKTLAINNADTIAANELIKQKLLNFWKTILIDSTDCYEQPLWKFKSKRIIVRDVFSQNLIDKNLGINYWPQLTDRSSPQPCKEVEVDKKGKLSQYDVTVTGYNHRVHGKVSEENLFSTDSQSKLYIQRKGPAVSLEGSMLLGCLRINAFKKSVPKVQMDTSYNNPTNPEYKEIIALGSTEQGVGGNLEFDKLEPFLKGLTPNIGPLANSIANYLVLMRYDGNEPRFKIMGNILRIKEK